ncbi:MAG: hypothetical protein K9M99_10640 [Candidatus Cloacimonetes bacterium]|nr:hypothetical protein [Candidatus Cloacimonadota bacterium]
MQRYKLFVDSGLSGRRGLSGHSGRDEGLSLVTRLTCEWKINAMVVLTQEQFE